MAAAGPMSLVDIAGPPLLGFFFNFFLSGVLAVQDLYYIGFPKDRWGLKTLVYGVFILEMTQTIIQCHDKFELYAKDFGDLASLNKQRLSWYVAIPVLTALTGGIVQVFLGWRIYTFSKNWFITISVWTMTLLATGAGMAQGIISAHLTLAEVSTHTEKTIITSLVATAVNDVVIAAVLTFYLNRMKSGVEKTDKLVSKIIRLTVETGSVTAIAAIIIVITFFVAPPWFLMFTDCIGKLYANNLMVMFNRRLTIMHNPSSSEISGNVTQLSTFRANSKSGSTGKSGHTMSSDTEVGSAGQYNSMGTLKSNPSFSATAYVPFETAKERETPGW
ncbi:hypothetical protein DL96DRAFT_1614091 [Flagelloscypha sp. PMI_526]|nr:hypothetical protein DL96DRAFT_1614091 [Flagelloscypha sp. PMI_526]